MNRPRLRTLELDYVQMFNSIPAEYSHCLDIKRLDPSKKFVEFSAYPTRAQAVYINVQDVIDRILGTSTGLPAELMDEHLLLEMAQVYQDRYLSLPEELGIQEAYLSPQRLITGADTQQLLYWVQTYNVNLFSTHLQIQADHSQVSPTLEKLTFKVGAVIGSCHIHQAVLRKIEVGDVLISSRPVNVLEIAGHTQFKIDFNGELIVLKEALNPHDMDDEEEDEEDHEEDDELEDDDDDENDDDENDANDEDDEDDEDDDEENDQDNDNDDEADENKQKKPLPSSLFIKDLPVALRFLLGEKTCSLAEINQLKPGYTFELAENSLMQVKVYAGKSLIASGELVEIGNSCGVQINKLHLTH